VEVTAPPDPDRPDRRLQIAPIQAFIENSHTLAIGIRSNAAPQTWNTGGWATQRLLIAPSSTSEFSANMQSASHHLRLGVLNLCQFPQLMPFWLLWIRIPKWLPHVMCEIWQYQGRDMRQGIPANTQRSTVAAATNSTELLAANPNRIGAIIGNNATTRLWLNLGDTASQTVYTAVIEPGGYYEVPYGYIGAVSGIWGGSFGGAQLTEFL
jgi:hypothetical protein